MDQQANARQALRESVAYWSNFLARCLVKRLDTDDFEEFIRIVYSKHRLPAAVIAEIFLSPQPNNDFSLDPRVPLYIQILSKLGYIDAPSIINALYKYSSLQSALPQQASTATATENAATNSSGEENNEKKPEERDVKQEKQNENSEGSPSNAPITTTRRWKNSSWSEEFMFYQVIKSIVEGTAFRETREALDLVHIISKWMLLFSAASNAFAADGLGDMQSSQVRDEMDVSRAAFVPLVLRLVEAPALVTALSRPHAKASRKELSESLASFTQTLQPGPGFAERLDLFRTDTLARLEPVDKKKQAADKAAMDELLQTTVGMENFAIADLPISNTRAGLYVFLNASVSH